MKLRTYCLSCRENANNIDSKRVTMKNKVIRGKSGVLIVRLISRDLWHKKIVKAVKRKKVNKILIKKVVIEYYKANMLTYCLVRKRNTGNKDAKMIKTKNDRLMLSSNCAVCGNKKSRFMKRQEAKGLFCNLGIKMPFSKIPLLGDLLF